LKNRECPHLSECKQFIQKHDFDWKCLGEYKSWNQENCELPIMWWGYRLLDNYEKIQSQKETR